MQQIWLNFLQVGGYVRLDPEKDSRRTHLSFQFVREEFFRSKHDKNRAGEKLTPCKSLLRSEAILKYRAAKRLKENSQKSNKENSTS